MSRESGGAFGVREAAIEEQYFRRLVHFTFIPHDAVANCSTHTGWAKLSDTIAVHYVVVNDCLINVDDFLGVKRQFTGNIKIKYWSLRGATKAEYVIHSSMAVFLTCVLH